MQHLIYASIENFDQCKRCVLEAQLSVTRKATFSFNVKRSSDYHIISNGQYKIMITGPNVGSLLQIILTSNSCIAFCLFWLTHFWTEGDFFSLNGRSTTFAVFLFKVHLHLPNQNNVIVWKYPVRYHVHL